MTSKNTILKQGYKNYQRALSDQAKLEETADDLTVKVYRQKKKAIAAGKKGTQLQPQPLLPQIR